MQGREEEAVAVAAAAKSLISGESERPGHPQNSW